MSLHVSVLVFSCIAFLTAVLDAKANVDWRTEAGFKHDKDKTRILGELDKVETSYAKWLRGDNQQSMVTLKMNAKSCEIKYVAAKVLIRLDTFIDKQVLTGLVTKAEADQIREELDGVSKVYIPQLESFLSQLTTIMAVEQMPSDVAAAEKTMQEAFKGYRELLEQIVDGLYQGLTNVMKTHFED